MKRDTEFLYLKLANNLREQILSGYIKPGEFLLSEFELAKHHGLSRASVRRALETLAAEGFVIKKSGQGTRVLDCLPVKASSNKTFNILTTSPSVFSDSGLSIIVDAFKELYPDTDVRVISIPVVMFWETVKSFEKSKVHPDILLVTDADIKNMEYSGSFIDLGLPLQKVQNLFYSKLLHAFRLDTGIQAVPVTFSTVFLAYNPVLFKKFNVPIPEDSWKKEEFIRCAKQLTLDTNADGITDLYGFSMTPALTRWIVLALQNGVAFNDMANNEQPLINTLDLIHDLLYRYRIAALYHPTSTGLGHFFNEKAAMTLTSSLEMATWKNAQMDFEPGIAPLPFGDISATLLITNSFMVPASTRSEALARSFIQTAFRPDVQEKFSRINHFTSVFKSVNEKVWSKSHLNSMNITSEDLKNSYFLHEIFPESITASEIEMEMEMYWDGLESASSTARHILDIILNR